MEHLAARGRSILGETIRIDPNAFYDDDGLLVEDKKIVVFVMDTAET